MSSDDGKYTPSEHEDEFDKEITEEEEANNVSDNSLMSGYSSVEEDRILSENYNHLWEGHGLVFDQRIKALEWMKTTAVEHNMYLVCATTNKYTIYVKCFRGNKHRVTPTKLGAKPRETKGSSRINCPFCLKMVQNQVSMQWSVETMGDEHGRHNHELGDKKEGYRQPSAIKPAEYEIIREQTEIGCRPSQILKQLKKNKKSPNYSKLRHNYNAKSKQKREKMGEIPPLAFLFNLLLENMWYERHEKIAGTNQIGDIFFADLRSISLCEQFHEILIIDATYKTNIWDLPLVEIIGFVPSGQNFHVGFAFLRDEKEERYTWLLEHVKMMLLDFPKPRLIITDRDYALMKAIKKVYPPERTKNLLCRHHIATDVHKYLTKVKGKNDMQKVLTSCWNAIVFAHTEKEYESAVENLEEEFAKYPRFVKYVKRIWLTKHREQFVACWVDELLHFGTVTTNRVESVHAQLKKELHSTQESFVGVWQAIERVVTHQLNTIKGKFEEARSKKIKYCRKHSFFSRLGGRVAQHAIRLMYNEIRDENTRYDGICACRLWKSHRLPCKCMIMESHKDKIPVDLVDIAKFWKTLHMDAKDDAAKKETRANVEKLLDEAVAMFKNLKGDLEMKRLADRLQREAFPEYEEYSDPLSPPRKGRPRTASGSRSKGFWETGFESVKKKVKDMMDGKAKENPKEKDNEMETEKEKQKAKSKRKNDGRSKEKGKAKANDDGRRPKIDKRWSQIRGYYLRHIPKELELWLTLMHDVRGDGQCGFRALIWWLFWR